MQKKPVAGMGKNLMGNFKLNDRPARHSYLTLDGLRGLAAIAVAVIHMPRVFNGFVVPNAHLAVDFFLQLSGFVIAYAYSSRIANGMRFNEFLWLRINRLYPAFLLGIGFGLLVGLVSLWHPNNGMTVSWSLRSLLFSSVLSIFMLPTYGSGTIGLTNYLYPLNPPLWSVFFEVIVNLAFLCFFRFLKSGKVALTTAIMAFIAAIPFALSTKTMNYGFTWDEFFGGLFRMASSFFVGVAIFNFGFAGKNRSNLLSAILFVILGCILFCGIRGLAFELAIISMAFPLIIMAAVKTNPMNQWFSWSCVQLGKTSYVLYAVHKPIYQLLYGAIVRFRPQLVTSMGVFLGISMLFVIVIFAWWLSIVYEPIARAMLNRLYVKRERFS